MYGYYIAFFGLFLGHVDPGESDWVTALRETQEEAGLSEKDLEVIIIFRI